MDILVLDTIHGGRELARHLEAAGHRIDAVDVYRGQEGIPAEVAGSRRYDRVIAPVHLDPDHPLLARGPVMSHHEAVGWILEGEVPGAADADGLLGDEPAVQLPRDPGGLDDRCRRDALSIEQISLRVAVGAPRGV
ncbi:MAG TPA: hypothetical protein VE134_05475, partial [Methanomicrobiales archaeon]|nr:hypothetical protein [Methanomicrobiales archaeon]